jgi:hypothetical protein
MAAVFSKWNVEALVTVGTCRVSRLDSAKKGFLPAAAKMTLGQQVAVGVTRVVNALLTFGANAHEGSKAGGTCPTTVCNDWMISVATPRRVRRPRPHGVGVDKPNPAMPSGRRF